ncbi:MAG: hypothetical protein PHW60_13560 [Kiritimatiellae bacterium]|nr:hypothetical protein [Kiritimatiellia bacterium]
MSMTCFLEVNGSLRSGRNEKWFQLPANGLAARSLRFGNHALVVNACSALGGDTMQILPLGDSRRLRLEPQRRLDTEPSRASRIASLMSNSKLFSFLM